MNYRRGFTIIEILVSIAIFMLVAGIGVSAFVSAKNTKELDVTVQSLVSKLNEARTNAIAGKNGNSFGIKFNSTGYVYFSGKPFNVTNPANITYSLPNGIVLTNTIPGPDYAVIFTRMSGVPEAIGDIILYRTSNPSKTQTIVIGNQGVINVVK